MGRENIMVWLEETDEEAKQTEEIKEEIEELDSWELDKIYGSYDLKEAYIFSLPEKMFDDDLDFKFDDDLDFKFDDDELVEHKKPILIYVDEIDLKIKCDGDGYLSFFDYYDVPTTLYNDQGVEVKMRLFITTLTMMEDTLVGKVSSKKLRNKKNNCLVKVVDAGTGKQVMVEDQNKFVDINLWLDVPEYQKDTKPIITKEERKGFCPFLEGEGECKGEECMMYAYHKFGNKLVGYCSKNLANDLQDIKSAIENKY